MEDGEGLRQGRERRLVRDCGAGGREELDAERGRREEGGGRTQGEGGGSPLEKEGPNLCPGSLLGLSWISLEWLANEHQGSTCLCFPAIGNICAPYSWLFK